MVSLLVPQHTLLRPGQDPGIVGNLNPDKRMEARRSFDEPTISAIERNLEEAVGAVAAHRVEERISRSSSASASSQSSFASLKAISRSGLTGGAASDIARQVGRDEVDAVVGLDPTTRQALKNRTDELAFRQEGIAAQEEKIQLEGAAEERGAHQPVGHRREGDPDSAPDESRSRSSTYRSGSDSSPHDGPAPRGTPQARRKRNEGYVEGARERSPLPGVKRQRVFL